MKVAGYIPVLEFALHDVGDHQKEKLLLWHSEKLAIAYGLIKLPRGVPIRVFKNLRVCRGCHEATKFISAIEKGKSLWEIIRGFIILGEGNAVVTIIGDL
ncbi:putative DYW domain-containing protein [Helianthus debilis subsp. tardiflorus]